MKILVIGDYKSHPSEGMEVVTKRFVDVLRLQDHNVSTVTTKGLLAKLRLLLGHYYDQVIFTHGPGLGAYLTTIFLSFLWTPKITWLATRPKLFKLNIFDLFLFKLDTIYCGKKDERLISLASRVNATFKKVVIGIDLSRVLNENEEDVTDIMLGENGDSTSPILMHVGHLRENRGLDKLISIKQKLGNKVNIVVIGSPSLSQDQVLINELEDAGIIIYQKYIANLYAFYQAADMYLFPVDPLVGGAVDLPLSVLEAIACGTPVMSTSFGVLEQTLKNHPLVEFYGDDFVSQIIKLVENGVSKEKNLGLLPEEFDLDFLVKQISINL